MVTQDHEDEQINIYNKKVNVMTIQLCVIYHK